MLAEAAHTVVLREKRDKLAGLLTIAHEKGGIGIMKEITKDANDRINELIPDSRLRIKEIKKCLLLEGQAGGSVGETLAVGYAFLATLFNRTDLSRAE